MSETSSIRLLVADDHELVRDGIRARLSSNDDFLIIGEASNGQEAVELTRKLNPDVLLMDISMPVMNGLEATRMIRDLNCPTRILILSIYDNPEYVHGVMQRGANGYILKDVSANEMFRAIRTVATGGFYLGPNVASPFTRDEPCTNAVEKYGLTTREIEVLRYIAQGLQNKDIARELSISVRTVESHRGNLRDKVGGGNAAFLTRIAHELKLL